MSSNDLHRISLLQQRVSAQSPSHKRDAQLARIANLRKQIILLEEKSRKLKLRNQMKVLAMVKQMENRQESHGSNFCCLESVTTAHINESQLNPIPCVAEEIIFDPFSERCLEFSEPEAKTLDAVEHHPLLEQPLGFLVVHEDSVECTASSIVHAESLRRPVEQSASVSDLVPPNEHLAKDSLYLSHEVDIPQKKPSDHIGRCDQFHPTSTVNLLRVRKGLAWQSRYISWIVNLNPCQCVQCYHANYFGLFIALRRNVCRRLCFYILDVNLEFTSEGFIVLCYILTTTTFVGKYLNFQFLPAEVLPLSPSNVFDAKGYSGFMSLNQGYSIFSYWIAVISCQSFRNYCSLLF